MIFISFCVFLAKLHAQQSQKIGLVLSGGGASGLVHIGVMKALEENNIPINYITGASIGALIGAYYASGYSPDEIEQIVKTEFFKGVTKGDLPSKYDFLIKKRNDYASWITFKINPSDPYIKNIPTNIINSIPIDYYLMETFSAPVIAAKGNFDSLFIPYRCIASDIENKKTVVFKNGSLSSVIRASLSYPFYLRPIKIDGKLLFDGGLYDNFPADVMQKEFNPDFIIGSNVSETNKAPDEDNVYQQIRSMLMSKTVFDTLDEKGVLIEPWSDVSTFNFENAKRLIDSGYTATLRAIPLIRKKINNMSNTQNINEKRLQYRKLISENNIIISSIETKGLNNKQQKFVEQSLIFNKKPFTMQQLKKRYFKLVSDEKIKSLFPVVTKNSAGAYNLELFGKKEKPLYIDLGAIISNRPISEAFLGIQYNHLGKIGFSAYANGYFGKLNSSTHARFRLDFPGRLPFYIEPSYTYSRWDYYNSSVLFYDFLKPAYLIQEDQFAELKVGVPVGNISQFNIAGGYSQWGNFYYQTNNFSKLDTTDKTYFNYLYTQASYNINTLNRKMYADEGTLVNIRGRFLQGDESFIPGNTGINKVKFLDYKQKPWVQVKVTVDKYLKPAKAFKFGIFAEGVYSTMGFFSNYQATILSAPAFNPTPESQTFFIDAYRAHNYLASGLKTITTPIKNFDIRLEAYVFQPVNSILKDANGNAYYSQPFLYRYFSGMAALVYNSPVGPFCVSFNYYDKNTNPFSVFFHFGYIIFNRKSID
ncbi:MAG: patatin-like phospholipase family protein [Bacteroidetes bacterium]|nr:patatin-like phospholipase family protein [Bacteroidota bacterium]